MNRLPPAVCEQILAMEQQDLALTQQLEAAGELPQYGYHPALEALHLANSRRLEDIMEQYAFPTLQNSSAPVHTAAWRIVQHAISAPAFMRRCCDLFSRYSPQEIPLSSRAYLEDRIAFYERRPQVYGTQFDYGLDGRLDVWWLADAPGVDARRRAAALPPLEEVRARFREAPAVSREEAQRMRREQEQWLVAVGWCGEEAIAHCRSVYGN